MKYLVFLYMLMNVSWLFSQEIYFPPLTGTNWETLSPDSLGFCSEKTEDLYDFLELNKTKAFIFLKDGKIVLEKYFGDHETSSSWYWASAGKTLTAFMVGIAQEEEYLNIHDKTSEYLGQGWTSCTPEQEDLITIRNQLTMTSGLDDTVDPFCTEDTCLQYKADAGTRWAYHNGPYTLLDEVLNNATGINLNLYINQKLKPRTGMTGLFVKLGYNNVFWSNARSMARFGLLILNNGNWNGDQIMNDTAYFRQMTHTSQSINEAYGYLWWLNGSSSFMVPGSQLTFPGMMFPDAPGDMISALGKNGQILNIVPGQNIVWLRMGEAPDSSEVSLLLNNNIWKYINQLKCTSSTEGGFNFNSDHISIYPNPASASISIDTEYDIDRLSIFSIDGILIKTCHANCSEIDISDITNGMYLLKIDFKQGDEYYYKLFKK